jgi:hypothetical protein
VDLGEMKGVDSTKVEEDELSSSLKAELFSFTSLAFISILR